MSLSANRYIPTDQAEAMTQLWQAMLDSDTRIKSLEALCDATVPTKNIIDMIKPLAREAFTYSLPVIYNEDTHVLTARIRGIDHGSLTGLADNDHTQYVNAVSDTASLDLTMAGQSVSGVVLPAGVDHNSLLNYSANRHVDHTAVSVIAGTGMSGGGDISANRTLNCTITQYTDALARAAISETVTGLDYSSATGVLSLTAGYVIPTTTEETNWNAAYAASHARAHNLLTVADHADVATYLNQALLTTSTPQFARLGIGMAAGSLDGVATASAFFSSPFYNFYSNSTPTIKNQTTPAIYASSNAGAAYPFLESGHLVLEPRESGATRDVVFIGASAAILGAVRGGGQWVIGNPDTADAVPLLRVWKATAGVVDSPANTLMTLETDGIGNALIIAPTSGGYFIGDTADADVGGMDYDHTNDILRLKAGGSLNFAVKGTNRAIFDTTTIAVNATNVAAFDIIQNSATDDIPVLHLRQDDNDEPFIHFKSATGVAATGKSLVDKDGMTTLGSVIGVVMIGIDDTNNQITDGDYYVPFYSPTFTCHP